MKQKLIQPATHCCKNMDAMIDKHEASFFYYPQKRCYAIQRSDSSSFHTLLHCPWCGVQLPKELLDEYYDTLLADYGIKAGSIERDDPRFPEEFKTDLWWKKRGL